MDTRAQDDINRDLGRHASIAAEAAVQRAIALVEEPVDKAAIALYVAADTVAVAAVLLAARGRIEGIEGTQDGWVMTVLATLHAKMVAKPTPRRAKPK